MYVQKSKWLVLTFASLLVAACASGPSAGPSASGSKNSWTNESLAAALGVATRPQADRDRDADRKPAQLMNFLGVKPGMTAVDVMASGGYMTEVLSITVGPKGKVYAQNPVAFLQYNNGMFGKAIGERVANNRLPNVVRTDGEMSTIAPNSVDVAVTAMNLHDIYNRDPKAAQAFVKGVYDALKPGGVFGVIDHAGNAGADNAKLHRMLKQQAIDAAKAAGFVVDAESDVLAHAADDHSKAVFDPALRGKTDQFVLKLHKPK
jgi:predicted methyltransferase